MTTTSKLTTDEKLDAALAEIVTLKNTVQELTGKVKTLEELATASHEILVAFSQSYYWTPEWQAKEARADEQARLGLGKVYDDVEELIRDLNQ